MTRENDVKMQDLRVELQRLGQSQAIETTMAAIAHELNQPLSAAAYYTAAIERALAADPLDPATIGLIRGAAASASQQALRAAEMLRRLRDHGPDRAAAARPEPVRPMVEEAVHLALIGRLAQHIEVRFGFPENLPPVFAERLQIQQVLVNLIRNAAEAMERTPRRLLSVGAAIFPEDRVVSFYVSDTGEGMNPTIIGRLFRPFVSAKQGGMGIGLAICRAIVEAHGGEIGAAPNLGGGTKFQFTIPISEVTIPTLEGEGHAP